MTASGMVRVSWALAVAFFVVTGLWPLVSPDTFFDALVAFPPYNAHLMRDIVCSRWEPPARCWRR